MILNSKISILGLLCLKKRSTEKQHLGKDYEEATDSKVYACSDIDLSKVLF